MTPTDRYRDKALLVTGAGGYLGSELVLRLKALGAVVTGVVHDRTNVPAPVVKACAELVALDLRREPVPTALLARQSTVFHLAAQTSVPVANADPEVDWEMNVRPWLRMLQGSVAMPSRPRFVLASTVTVVGLPARLPADEETCCHPITVYDMHKLEAERYGIWYHRQHRVEAVTLRLSNVYGPSVSAARNERGVMQKMARLALRGEPLPIHGGGAWRRDYLYLSDAVEAFVLAGCADGEVVAGKSFQVCSGIGTPFVDAMAMVASEAARMTGKKCDLRHEPASLDAISQRDFFGLATRLTKATGWTPSVPLADGIRRLLEKSNR